MISDQFAKLFTGNNSNSAEPLDCNWFLRHQHSNDASTNHANCQHQQQQENKLNQMAELWKAASLKWKQEKSKREEHQRHHDESSNISTHQQQYHLHHKKQKQQQQQSQKRKELNFENDEDYYGEVEKPITAAAATSLSSSKQSSSTVAQLIETGLQDYNKSISKNNNDSNIIDQQQHQIRRVLSSVLEVETVKDIEVWSVNLALSKIPESVTSSFSNSSSRRPSSSFQATTSITSSSSSPEALRWMSAAEKNLLPSSTSSSVMSSSSSSSSSSTSIVQSSPSSSTSLNLPDFVNAIKNYSNALQCQINFCTMMKDHHHSNTGAGFTTSVESHDADGFSISSEKKPQLPFVPSSSTSSSSSSATMGGCNHHNNNSHQLSASHYSSKITNPEQKMIVAVILSNRAACRIGLCDYEGALIDANDALYFCDKLPSALARLAFCLLVAPAESSIASSSSANGFKYWQQSFIHQRQQHLQDKKTNAQKLLAKCDLGNESSSSVFTNNNNNNLTSLPAITTFNTKHLIEAANAMSEYDDDDEQNAGATAATQQNIHHQHQQSAQSLISKLQSLEEAESAISNCLFMMVAANATTGTTTIINFHDPRFDLIRAEVLSSSGNYEDAASELSKLLNKKVMTTSSSSSSSTMFSVNVESFAERYAEAWSLRGLCVFRSSCDGSSASMAIQCFRKAASICRDLHSSTVSRCFHFSSISSPTMVSSSSSSSSSTTTKMHQHQHHHHHHLFSLAAKFTVSADALQAFEKMENKLSIFFSSFSSSSSSVSTTSSSSSSSSSGSYQTAIKIATELLTVDLLGHRTLRAFILLRRGILMCEMMRISSSSSTTSSTNNSKNNEMASRGIDDVNTALKLLEMDSSSWCASSSSSSSSSSFSMLGHTGSINNNSNSHNHTNVIIISLFVTSLYVIRATCHQHCFAYLRALEDIQTALVSSAPLNDTSTTSSSKSTSSTATTTNSAITKAILLRHPELERFVNRKVMIEMQEYLKTRKFSHQQSHHHHHHHATTMKKQQRFFERQREEAVRGNNKYTQEEFEKEWATHQEVEEEREEKERNATRRRAQQHSSSTSSAKNDSDNSKDENGNGDSASGPSLAAAVVMINHYDVLGVSKSATLADISRSFRAAALRLHPDKWCGLGVSVEAKKHAEEHFKMLNNAYSVLRDETQRARYDAEMELK